MTNFFKKYRWVFMLVLFAIVLSFGIVLFVNPGDIGEIVSCFFTGAFICAFGVFRLIPLIKRVRTNKVRLIINSVEITCDILIGALLFGFAFNESLRNSYIDLYKYLVALVIFARGVIYFVETSFLNIKSEPTKFIVHIACIALGSIIVVSKNFDANLLNIVFASLLMVLAVYCAADSIYSYVQYSKIYSKPKTKVKEIKEKKETKKESKKVETAETKAKVSEKKEIKKAEPELIEAEVKETK